MSTSKKWTPDFIREALDTLLHTTNYEEALEEIGETSNALAGAFTRNGLEAPTFYLASSEEEAARRRLGGAPEGWRTIVVVNDVHVPFHNKQAVEGWLELCRDIQPEIIVINGDFLDCHSISTFPKDVGFPTLQEELDEGLEILERLRRSCPTAVLHFTEGNHEERLRRLIKREHGLYGLRSFSLESLLEFERLGIHYYDYGVMLTIGNLDVYHGTVTRGMSAYSARGELDKAGSDFLITGHTHRMGWYHHKDRRRNKQALENGGLYDLAQCEYMFNPNWQNGFCVVYQRPEITDDQGEVVSECVTQMHPIYVQYDGTFCWGAKYYG